MSQTYAPDCPKRSYTLNVEPDSCQIITLTCSEMWSFFQQYAHTRLCHPRGIPFTSVIGGDRYANTIWDLEESPAKRARIIAATYARLYLEEEKYGNAKLKGRYYWMALGAFASKTVACTLELWRVHFASAFSPEDLDMPPLLAKGNLWLFQDIAPWHLYYSVCPTSFADCAEKRSVPDALCPVYAGNIMGLPYSTESLPKINHLRVTDEIRKGFKYVAAIEKESSPTERRDKQFKHLIQIANHEQLKILQPLIYENGVMQGWLKMQRALENKVTGFIIPDLELVFTSDCELDMTKVKNRHSAQHAPMPKEEELVSKAPEDTVLENSKSRMKWIGKAAEQFHGLMGKYPDFMELELQTMTKWWEPV